VLANTTIHSPVSVFPVPFAHRAKRLVLERIAYFLPRTPFMIILETRLVFREMVTHKAQGGLLVVTGIRDLEGRAVPGCISRFVVDVLPSDRAG